MGNLGIFYSVLSGVGIFRVEFVEGNGDLILGRALLITV